MRFSELLKVVVCKNKLGRLREKWSMLFKEAPVSEAPDVAAREEIWNALKKAIRRSMWRALVLKKKQEEGEEEDETSGLATRSPEDPNPRYIWNPRKIIINATRGHLPVFGWDWWRHRTAPRCRLVRCGNSRCRPIGDGAALDTSCLVARLSQTTTTQIQVILVCLLAFTL